MFCSQCGAEADGKFCWNCGSAVHGRPAGGSDTRTAGPEAAAGPTTEHWADETSYDMLIGYPDVRHRIGQASAMARDPMDADKVMSLFDKLAGVPLPTMAIAEIAQPLYAKLGIHTGKTRREEIARPVGRVIVDVLCSLARQGIPIRNVQQATDGCTINAALPKDLRAMGGDLVVNVTRTQSGAAVEASTNIPGQLRDLGKSAAILRALFTEASDDRGP